jgi:hypothetical protein
LTQTTLARLKTALGVSWALAGAVDVNAIVSIKSLVAPSALCTDISRWWDSSRPHWSDFFN